MRPPTIFCLIFAPALLAIGLSPARAASRHHSVNISDGHKRPIVDCSNLHIQFDDQDAVVRSEERAVTKAEAPVLKVRPHANGGVQVVGWDKENYSVRACKAVLRGDAAERRLSQITTQIENGTVSTKGPAEAGSRTVYLPLPVPENVGVALVTTDS